MLPLWWQQGYQLELELEAENVKVGRRLCSNFQHISDHFLFTYRWVCDRV